LAGTVPGGRVIMNAPDPVEPGSSISHFDPIASRNQLMEPNISNDLTHSVKAPQDLTQALLWDIGWAPDLRAAFSSNAIAFGDKLMGYGNFSYAITISGNGIGRLNIDSVGVTGSPTFSQTNNCPAQLLPTTSCTVTVTFNPASLISQTGSLTIATNAQGSPHVLPISGRGISDLAFSLSRPRRPVRAGVGQASSNVYELTITPAPGFSGNMELSCTGEDASISCAILPRTVNVAGAPVVAEVTVKATARSQRLRRAQAMETRMIKVTALVGGVARTVELPVQLLR
jgi:hypothetical protein